MFLFRPWPRRQPNRQPYVKPSHRRRGAIRPRLEALEKRWVPSTYADFFELDGNILSQGSTNRDWDKVYSDFHSNTSLSGTGALNFYNDLVPVTVPFLDPSPTSEDTLTGGNSKDIYDMNLWTYGTSAPQNKANLENAIAAAYLDADNGHTYLYVGATRYDNSGSTTIGVWFLQTPVGQSGGRIYELNSDGSINLSAPAHHQNGDLLLVANFGSGAATFTSFTWNNGAIPTVGTTLDVSIGKAMVNAQAMDGTGDRTPVPWPYRSSARGAAANFVQSNQFFEAGVDLNLLFPGQTNFNFSSFIVETRSSTSPSATLSDIIVGHVSTAPDVTVSVEADASPVDAGSQIGFTVTVENVGAGGLTNVTLTDLLPAGPNNDIVWSIAPGGNPSGSFELNGVMAGSQTLELVDNLNIAFNAAPLTVHLIASTSGDDVGTLTNHAAVAASNEAPNFLTNNTASDSITLISSGMVVSDQFSVEGESHLFDLGTFNSATGGTWTIVVNWGDGSTNTTFDLTNTANVPVPIPDQLHTYWEQGSYPVNYSATLGAVTKNGSFNVTVSNPAVIASALTIPTQTYDGFAVGVMDLATFRDPGGAEGVNMNSHYTATIDWGGMFGTSAGTLAFSGSENSFTDLFSISGSIPYVNVGTYYLTISIDHEGVPTGPVNVTVVIDPKLATVIANNRVKTYGDAVTFAGTEFTTSGFVGTDGVTSASLSSSGAAASATYTAPGPDYAITASAAVGTGLTNYTISYTAGNLHINQRALTITPSNASKTYGDALSFAGTEFSTGAGQLVNGDSVSSVLLASAGAAASATYVAPGPDYAINASSASGSGLGNYSISYATGNLHINQRALTITANSRNKTYGNAVTFAGTEFSTGAGQLVNGNSVSTVVLSSAGAAASATYVSPGPDYVIAASDASGSGLGNYAIQYVAGNLHINQRGLTITANNATKTYGDAVTFAGTEFGTGAGQLVNGDNVSSVLLASAGAAASATYTSPGPNYAITVGNASGTGLGNYAISYVDGNLHINQRALTITANSTSKTYGQTVTFAGTEFSTAAGQLVNGNNVTSVTLTSAGAGATAGVAGSPYSIVPSAAVGSGLGNYVIGYVNGSLGVNRAHLTVTPDNDAINEGTNPSGQLSATITGFVNGETSSVVSGSPVLTTDATGISPPGNGYYIAVNIAGLTAANYDFTAAANGTLAVVDVAPTIVMSTGTIRLTPGDGFTRNGSYTDPGIVVLTETWTLAIDYGDGTTVNGASTPGNFGLSHSYPATGSYTVTVTIGDNYGASSQRTFTVTVAPLPTLDLYNNGNLIGGTASGTRNNAFTLDCHFTQATSGTGSFSINWGDPAGDKPSNPNVQSGTTSGASGDFSRSHVYRHAGTYTVSVTFTDVDGDSITKTFLLTIV